MIGRALVAALLLAALLAALVRGADEACGEWPAFSSVEPSAGDIVLVKVIGSEDGVARDARTVDVIRGESTRRWKLRHLDPGQPAGPRCSDPPPIYADVGDRLVLALDGTLPERTGRVDTMALITLKPRHPNRSGLERWTREQAEAIDDERPEGAVPLSPDPIPPPRSVWDQVVEGLGDIAGPFQRTVLVPWPERTPAPLPAGAELLEVEVQDPAPPHPMGEDVLCRQARGGGVLLVVDGTLVTDTDELVVWPRGFSARLVDGRAELVAPDGTVIGRDGDDIEAGGGYRDAVRFLACSVEGVVYGPAS